MPEHPQKGMPEHEQYEALCALAAGGLLESEEYVDFEAHVKECSECRSNYQELLSLVTRELPQTQGAFRQKLAVMRAKPLPYSRQRFLRRARAGGVVFSREVETSAPARRWYLRPVAVLVPLAGVVVVGVSLLVYDIRETSGALRAKDAAAARQVAELKKENSALAASLSQLNSSLAAGQNEIQNLRAQLGKGAPTAERSSSQNAQLLEEARNQEKLLAEARDEAARINQLRVNDQASLAEQQARITDLSYKLRIASATLDMERQLVAEGKNVRELMVARQLHVIDVRDTDPNGKPSEAFGRVFLTEGKSLTFYAFDLDQNRVLHAKNSFEVWAVPEAKKDSARSLGFLQPDAEAQGRWVLRVETPGLLKEIVSVFVTAEPAAGGKQPGGQKMLYAYLGEANHP